MQVAFVFQLYHDCLDLQVAFTHSEKVGIQETRKPAAAVSNGQHGDGDEDSDIDLADI